MKFKRFESIGELQPGDVVRHMLPDEPTYFTVTTTSDGRATAVAVADITDPNDWAVLPRSVATFPKPRPEVRLGRLIARVTLDDAIEVAVIGPSGPVWYLLDPDERASLVAFLEGRPVQDAQNDPPAR